MTLVCVSFTLLAAQPARLSAQFNPYGNRTNSYEQGADPRLRRAFRERAVAAVGPVARDFVETHGEEAAAAIFACSKPVAEKLAQWHASGGLGKVPRPRDLLFTIAQPRHGNDVALWAIQHATELTDTDCFDAYLFNPLEYALGLKQLAAGAAEARARRLSPPVTATRQAPFPLTNEQVTGVVVIGFFVMLVLLWRRRRAASY
jgi:hypothetical protein